MNENTKTNRLSVELEQLEHYKKFSLLLEKMIGLAEEAKWELFTALQNEYLEAINNLPDFSTEFEITDDLKILARELIEKVITQDNQLMKLIKKEHSNVSNSLTTLNNQHKVHTVYTKFSDQGIEKQILRDL